MTRGLELALTLPRADFALQLELTLPADGISVLYGASGSGKTSILRCVAGLERARPGTVVVDGAVWQDESAGVFLPTHRRALGYVFQEASLFDHLDVRANLRYGMQRSASPHRERTLDDAVELLGIAHLLSRRPGKLSGGERQRVAIARALATGPRLLLLDEPMASLDAARRQEILPWLERLRDQLRLPMLYVTHAVDELARLADHLVVLQRGRVLGSGPVQELLSSIAAPLVVGEDAGALLQGQVVERDAQWNLMRVAIDGADFWLRDNDMPLGHPVRVRVLARDVSLSTERPVQTSIQNQFPCVVEALAPDAHPSQMLVRVRCGPSALIARVTRRAVAALRLEAGQAVWTQVKSVAVVQ